MKKLVMIGSSQKNINLLKRIIDDNRFFGEIILLDEALNKNNFAIYKSDVISQFRNQTLNTQLKFSTDETALLKADYILLTLDEEIDIKKKTKTSIDHIVEDHYKAIQLVPKMMSWIEKIKKYADTAHVINITSPIGIITEAVCRYGDIENFVSLNSKFDAIKIVINGFFNDAYKQLTLKVVGLYDDSYITNIYNGKTDILDKVIEKIYMTEEGKNIVVPFSRQLGLIPCQSKFDDVRNLNSLTDDTAMSFLNYVESIEKDLRGYQIVNLANLGHVLDLPQNCAIEVTSRITSRGARPIHIGHLPLQIRGSIQHLKAYEEFLVDAIYENNKEKMRFALSLHPMIKTNTSIYDEVKRS